MTQHDRNGRELTPGCFCLLLNAAGLIVDGENETRAPLKSRQAEYVGTPPGVYRVGRKTFFAKPRDSVVMIKGESLGTIWTCSNLLRIDGNPDQDEKQSETSKGEAGSVSDLVAG
jgi:hypothetical protein